MRRPPTEATVKRREARPCRPEEGREEGCRPGGRCHEEGERGGRGGPEALRGGVRCKEEIEEGCRPLATVRTVSRMKSTEKSPKRKRGILENRRGSPVG